MNRVYLKNVGIYHQHAKSSVALSALVASEIALVADEQDLYNSPEVELVDKNSVSREDRAVLNSQSKIVLNALSDLGTQCDLTLLSESTLYSACDSEEHNLSALRDIINRDPDAFWSNVGELKKHTNPLEMLRLLPTNPLYHVSKVLKNHSEGVALRAASLSGMMALKLAHEDIASGSAPSGALIVNSANMLSLDSLVMFSKFGEIRAHNGKHSGIIPSWGGVAAHLHHDSGGALAEVLAVTMQYKPFLAFDRQHWVSLFTAANQSHGAPDIIISYENGITSQGESERAALREVFPDVPVLTYKPLTGYGGKVNNLVDIACAMNDVRLKPGTKLLFNGAGMMQGLGCALLQKNREMIL